MKHDRISTKSVALAKDIKKKLIAYEAALDDAIVLGAELNAACARGRQEAGLSATVGSEAVELVGDSSHLLSRARAKTVRAHHSFVGVLEQLGFTIFASGDLWKFAARGDTANEHAAQDDALIERVA